MFVQRDVCLLRLTQTLACHKIPLDTPDVLVILEQMISSLEDEFGTYLESGATEGLLLHLFFCRVPEWRQSIRVKDEARVYIERQFPYELSVCRWAISKVNQQGILPLPDEEAYNLLGILKQIDIFINIGE